MPFSVWKGTATQGLPTHVVLFPIKHVDHLKKAVQIELLLVSLCVSQVFLPMWWH